MRILAAALTAAAVSANLIVAPAAAAQPTAAATVSACGELGGTVDADDMCRVHVENPTYRLDYTFPADYPDQQALTDYLTRRTC